MVCKKEGGWSGDYRRLNNVMIPDQYPLLNIVDFTFRIPVETVFSNLDLKKGYYQVPMAFEDIQKTAIVTPFGMFKFFEDDLWSPKHWKHLSMHDGPCFG